MIAGCTPVAGGRGQRCPCGFRHTGGFGRAIARRSRQTGFVTSVAVLGTGIMGTGMARSLVRAGHQVRVWNRTAAKAEPLAADGATVGATVAETVAGVDVVITMLFDTDAVLAVLGEIEADLSVNTVLVQSSTIGRDGTARVAEVAASRGLSMVDAPVLGTKGPAEQGTLTVLASGDESLLAAAAPVFDAIGARTVWAGGRLGDASALKLACNAWVSAINAANAQSMRMTEAVGLDPRLFLEAISGGAVDTAYAHVKGALIVADDFPVSFTVDGVVKDLGLIRDQAVGTGVPTGLIDAALGLYRTTVDRGLGDRDMAAVVHAFDAPDG